MAEQHAAEDEREPDRADHWHEQLQLANREERDWREEAEKVVDRYKDERRPRSSGNRLNVLAATMELLRPSVFARAPKPSVRRRRMAEDPMLAAVGREAAIALERTLDTLTTTSLAPEMERAASDLLLTGRGVGRVLYDAEFAKRTDVQRIEQPAPVDMMTGLPLGPPQPPVYLLDGQPTMPEFDAKGAPFVEQKLSETVEFRHVFWSDFRHEPARCWADVGWCAFRHVMSKRQLREEFGGARDIPLTIGATHGEPGNTTDPDTKSPADPPSRKSKAVVWEIWSKHDLERIWIAEGHDKVVRRDPDPLGLEGFFPCPEPVRHIAPTDSLVPIPEFRWWKDQADELDCIQDRIRHLVQVARAVLIVDGSLDVVIKVETAEDGTAIPTASDGDLARDLANSIFEWPLATVVQTITVLTQRAEVLKQQIFEISGVSDIMRGSVAERESAAASKMKVGFGRVRQTPRSAPMARFVRDTLAIMGEVVAEHFDAETIGRVAGVQVAPPVMQLLREEKLRSVTLEISDEDMVAEDRQAEKAEAGEFMGALASFAQQLATLGPVIPQMVPLLVGTMKLALRPFKASREVEELIDATVQQLSQQAAEQQAQQQAMQAQQQAMQAQAMGAGGPPRMAA